MSNDPTGPGEPGVSIDLAVGLRLVVEEPGAHPRVVVVPAGGRMTVGRATDVDLPLADKDVSRRHAVIAFDGDRATVRDLGSRHGTHLNERSVSGESVLDSGDVIRLGGTHVSVVLVNPRGDAASTKNTGVVTEPGVVASDPATIAMFKLLTRLAKSRIPVLLQGETGSGKEVAARAVHRSSSRASGPFVAINCATLAEGLAESDLFGHEKGSFTGATSRRLGAFESADGGTLFLDEVADLSLPNQARLLRALEQGVITRVGGTSPIRVDVRVVAATHRDLASDVSTGRFREDLYFRLNGATCVVPALRSRPLDLLPLAQHYLAARDVRLRFGPGVAEALRAYRWPGNVRELRHAIEHAAALCSDDVITLDDLPAAVRGLATPRHAAVVPTPNLQDRVDETERREIIAALEANDGNQTHAARALGITRRALIYRMERHGLKGRPGSSDE